MHADMSDGVKLAITLLVCAYVLSIGLTLWYSGQNANRVYINAVSDTYTQSAVSEIMAIANYDDDIPASSLYLALSKEPDIIESISGSAYGVTINNVEDLRKLFRYQVHATVSRNADMFRIVISP